MELFDAHAHYNDEQFNMDREEIIKGVYESGVTKIINAGYDLKSSREAVDIASKYDFIYATCGISPNDIKEENRDELSKIIDIAKDRKIVAIGEIGLDYHWNDNNKELQKEMFIKQVDIANQLDLPIVIHTREAIYDTLDILKNEITVKHKGMFHCCPINVDLVKQALKLGFYISFAGPITYKSSKYAEEVIKTVPLDRMLIETDSPYLSPETLRGTRNDSRNMKLIVRKIAEVKQIDEESIAMSTYKNALEMIGNKG